MAPSARRQLQIVTLLTQGCHGPVVRSGHAPGTHLCPPGRGEYRQPTRARPSPRYIPGRGDFGVVAAPAVFEFARRPLRHRPVLNNAAGRRSRSCRRRIKSATLSFTLSIWSDRDRSQIEQGRANRGEPTGHEKRENAQKDRTPTAEAGLPRDLGAGRLMETGRLRPYRGDSRQLETGRPRPYNL